MPIKLTIDPATGMAGDMFIAALLDSGSRLEGGEDFKARILDAMRFVGGLLGEADVAAEKIARAASPGTRLVIRLAKNNQSLPAGRMRGMLETTWRKFDFSASQRELADRAFMVLCRAEELAHRALDGHDAPHHGDGDDVFPENVHLHEAQDLLLDITGFVMALGLLHVDTGDVVCLSPVRYGGGTVSFSHGDFPVPAPAVKEMIEAFRIPAAAGPIDRELLTPTGASIIAALAPRYKPRDSFAAPSAAAAVRGIGLGTLDFYDRSGRGNGVIVYLEGLNSHGK
ncbi:MAG: DUF111 family protein [Spirochaetales bacterium]|nr:DUF111 family protein [Spirochaetales bacterium]